MRGGENTTRKHNAYINARHARTLNSSSSPTRPACARFGRQLNKTEQAAPEDGDGERGGIEQQLTLARPRPRACPCSPRSRPRPRCGPQTRTCEHARTQATARLEPEQVAPQAGTSEAQCGAQSSAAQPVLTRQASDDAAAGRRTDPPATRNARRHSRELLGGSRGELRPARVLVAFQLFDLTDKTE